LTELKAAHAAKDLAKIEVSLKTINDAWSAASQDMYNAMNNDKKNDGANQDQNQNNQGGNANQGGGKDENVTDVDFEEVK